MRTKSKPRSARRPRHIADVLADLFACRVCGERALDNWRLCGACWAEVFRGQASTPRPGRGEQLRLESEAA